MVLFGLKMAIDPKDDWIQLAFDSENKDGDNRPDADCPWFQLHRPKRVEDLAVHSGKVQEVKSWLLDVFAGRTEKRIALLTGSSGCGKSATVRTVSAQMSCEIIEFNADPANDQQDKGLRSNQVKDFESFILDANRYSRRICDKKSLILCDEWSFTFYQNCNKYHDALRNCLRFYPECVPVVLILSPNSSQNSTSIMKHFPPRTMEELNIKWIKFNPIAESLLKKAVEKIPACSSLCESEMKSLIADCSGDIRSLLNQLEVHCKNARSDRNSNPKRQKVEQVEQRNVSKDSFHYIGKILHVKRRQENHDPMLGSKPPLHEDIDRLIDCRIMSVNRLVLSLHQNYWKTGADLNNLMRAAELMSIADVVGRAPNVSLDTRHYWEEYEAQLTVRGMMYNLPYTLVSSEATAPKNKTAGKSARNGIFGPLQGRALNNAHAPHMPSSAPSSTVLNSTKPSVILQKKIEHYDHCRSQKELMDGAQKLSQSLLSSRFSPLELFMDVLPYVPHIQENQDPYVLLLQKFSLLLNTEMSRISPENLKRIKESKTPQLGKNKEKMTRVIFKKEDGNLVAEAQECFVRGIQENEDITGYQIDWDESS